MSEQNGIQKRIESIEGLVREIENVSDPAARSLSKQLVQSLMDLHGSGFERMLEIVHRNVDTGQQIIDELGRDPLTKSLLLLYGLHPLDLQTRIVEALEKSRPYLRSHGGNVELARVSEAGVVTLRLEGSCHSCPSSAVTLQSTVEQAIYDAAPDVTSIIVEGAVQDSSSTIAFVPVTALQGTGNAHISESIPSAAPHRTDWEDVAGLEALAPGTLRKQDVGGKPVLFCKLNENFYAYGVTCPGCGQPLDGGRLDDTFLACPICRQRFDLVHAGRGVDISDLHLEPIPLLQENGRARIAILSRAQRSAT